MQATTSWRGPGVGLTERVHPPGYAARMPARTRAARRLVAVGLAVVVLVGGCGRGDDDDDQTPDEASFCRLAFANDPVAEASAPVLRRMDELAPEEVDDAVVVLRAAAEELAELPPRSPEAIAAEFEIRFRDDYIVARREVEAYVRRECREYRATTSTTTAEVEGGDDT
jgi:hypothetical protein